MNVYSITEFVRPKLHRHHAFAATANVCLDAQVAKLAESNATAHGCAL